MALGIIQRVNGIDEGPKSLLEASFSSILDWSRDRFLAN